MRVKQGDASMARFFDTLSDQHTAVVARQPLFFVAAAAEGARINLGSKDMDSSSCCRSHGRSS